MKFSYPQWNFHYPQRCNIHYHDESFITSLTQMRFSIPHSSTRYFKHLLLLLNSLWEWVALCVSLYKVKSVIARPITKQSLSLQSWKWLSLAMTERTWTVCLFLNSLWEWVPLCVSLYQVKSVIARPITNRSFLCRVGNSFSWQWRTEPELFVCLFVWLFVSEFSEVKSTIARPIRAFIWKVLNSFH